MSIQMLFDYVLVESTPVQEVTTSGFMLSGSSVEKPATGIVISVGEGKFTSTGSRIEHGIQVGDTVIFSKSALNQPLTHDGKDYHVMIAEQIFGVDR